MDGLLGIWMILHRIPNDRGVPVIYERPLVTGPADVVAAKMSPCKQSESCPGKFARRISEVRIVVMRVGGRFTILASTSDPAARP